MSNNKIFLEMKRYIPFFASFYSVTRVGFESGFRGGYCSSSDLFARLR